MNPRTTTLALTLAACGRDPEAGRPPDSADPGSDDRPAYPDLPPSTCGAPAYDWLPLDRVGRVVAV
jgi:hypothetical protein